MAGASDKIEKSDAEWRQLLDAETFRVTRKHGTERAFTSPLNTEKRAGAFKCVVLRSRALQIERQVRLRNRLAKLHTARSRKQHRRKRRQFLLHAAH